jgi:collagenase-like PrtC family protease
MGNNYNCGYNFDINLVDTFKKLHDKYPNHRITTAYGSIAQHAEFSARPDFRLPDISEKELEQHIIALLDEGIGMNYTMNNIMVPPKKDWMEFQPKLVSLVHRLGDWGVSRITVSNSAMLNLIARYCPDVDIKIEISTIAHVDAVMQLGAYKAVDSRIDRVCGNIAKNREFKFLKAAAKEAKRLGMTYEVMINEFCSTAGKTLDGEVYATHCIHRDECYAEHGTNKTKKDALAFSNYPMSKCMSGRASSGADWLRSMFVLPQHQHYYNDVGINNFKITGRTATTPYIEAVCEYYMAERFDGNLMHLWKPLETIYTGVAEADHKYKFDIPTAAMDNFLEPWISDKNFSCNNTTCMECKHCDNWYAMMMLSTKLPKDSKDRIDVV